MPMPRTKREQILAHIQTLCQETFDSPSLAKLLGIKLVTVSEYLGVLHQKQLVHIAGWRHSGNTKQSNTRVYRMGPGEDQPKPKQTPSDRKASNAAYFKKWYQRRKEQQPPKYRGVPSSVFDLAHHL